MLKEEDFSIMRSLKEIFRQMYDRYFLGQAKGENILKKLFKFLKDLEVSPYLINTKSAFMIYYFTSVSQCRPDEVLIDLPSQAQVAAMN